MLDTNRLGQGVSRPEFKETTRGLSDRLSSLTEYVAKLFEENKASQQTIIQLEKRIKKLEPKKAATKPKIKKEGEK